MVAEQQWGRALITGGIDLANNESDYPKHKPHQNLVVPHIPRALCHIRVTKILSAAQSRYSVALDDHGSAWLIGRHFTPAYASPSSARAKHDARLDEPVRVSPPNGRCFVDGSVGRTRVYLVDDRGAVWGCGRNGSGMLGAPQTDLVPAFKRIDGPWVQAGLRIVQITCGALVSLFLDNAGRVYAAGCGEFGALGNGRTGEYLLRTGSTSFFCATTPQLVSELQDSHIVAIASGQHHSLALDKDGKVWSWGRGDAGQLGLLDQGGRLRPTLVPQFGPNGAVASQIVCGHTSSLVVDAAGACWITGAWRPRGPGSAATPHVEFTCASLLLDDAHVLSAHIAYASHFFVVRKPDGARAVLAFGQTCAFGSLGLGKKGRTANTPTPVAALAELDVIDIAPAMFHTLVLVRPDAAFEDVPRHPEKVPSARECLVCHTARLELLECQKCDAPYHPDCLTPPIAWPETEWFCPACAAAADAIPPPSDGDALAVSYGHVGAAGGAARGY
ncbi:hypothetical protein Q5752_006883 [Cryptotrichosporon argae]